MSRCKEFKCSICGKYIAYNDIPDNVDIEFIPDTEFTIEEVIMTHKKCKRGK